MEKIQSNNFDYFLNKLIKRKKIQPKQQNKKSFLNQTEYIEECTEYMDACDWEIYEILNRKDDDEDKEDYYTQRRERQSRSCRPELFFETE